MANASQPNGVTGWPTRGILRTLALIAGFYLILQLLWVGRPVVLLSLLGVLFGLALSAGVDWLERWRMARAVGAVLIVPAFLGVLVGIGALTAPSITSQLREFKTQLPEAIGKIQRWVHERQQGVTQVLKQVAPADTAPADQTGEEGKLLILDVKAAIALGIIAGILEFIPIAGPILSSVPAIAMGFLDGPKKAVYIGLAYVVIQQLEANLLYPLIMKKGVELPPVLTIVAQGVMSIVFGFLGLLVAVPMLAAATVPIKMLYVRDVVGDPVRVPGEEAKNVEKRRSRADRGDADGGTAGKGLAVLLMALVPVAACSSRQQKLQELNRTAHSWEATARLTKELWEKGAVSAGYAQQTIAATAGELEKTRRRSEKLSQ
jgi:predicted PurR-regulated permease PerM